LLICIFLAISIGLFDEWFHWHWFTSFFSKFQEQIWT
jgi:hypothetical protein